MATGGDHPVRLAMWSGPRNISTALLTAFDNRADTVGIDEPLYAHYLAVTGLDHPGRDDILAAQPTDWREVTDRLTGPVPGGHAVWYQKQMTHHLTPDMGRDWTEGLTNCFLIREPGEVIRSYVKVRSAPTLEDLGLPQQVELFDRVRARTGQVPPVLDSRDVLENPPGLLRALCEAVGIPFLESMLSWEPGSRAAYGVWEKHWYGNVLRSTGFAPYRPPREPLPERFRELYETCLPFYRHLAAHRLAAA